MKMSHSGIKPLRIAVTGAAGQVAYASLFRIAAGELFGGNVPVTLQLLDVESAMSALDGVALELEDGAFPLLADIVVTSDARQAFEGASWVLLLGAQPRGKGMERSDLLRKNAGLFAPQGKAIGDCAASDVRVLVVGNPCNTNCLIASRNAPDVPSDRWFAMTRLDENRARSMLARKAQVNVGDVSNVTIWGNHSSTQYPDAYNAKISGRPAVELIDDLAWIDNDFITSVQQRGAEIIERRGSSSAGSAANAIIDCVRMLAGGTPKDDWTSVGVVSHGEYGVPEGLVYSFPVESDGSSWSVVEGLPHDRRAQQLLRETSDELAMERDMISDALK